MATASILYPEQKVHKTVLEEPPQRLIDYLENKLDLKQPVQRSELSNTLADIAMNFDDARFDRLTQDIYKIYEDLYTRNGDSEGKVSLNDYRRNLFQRNTRRGTIDLPTPPDDDDPEEEGSKKKNNKGGKPKTDSEDGNMGIDKDQEILYYQLAIGALALFLLISIAR